MKSIKPTQTLTLAALSIASLLFAAPRASAAGYKLADKVGADIAEFRDEIVDVKKAVDVTMAALDKVVADATVDPRKAFKTFDNSVPKIDSAAAKAKKRATNMTERGKEYYDKWEKDLASVTDPEIRRLAEERKAKLQATFANIRTTMEPARDQFNAFIAGETPIQRSVNQNQIHAIGNGALKV